MLQVLASDCERDLQREFFVCTVALRLMENWFEAMPALFESLSAVLVLSVLKPVFTSFLSTNVFVEGDHGKRKKSHEAPKSVARCFYQGIDPSLLAG